jgi:outer membrane biosynthesis protein TonB
MTTGAATLLPPAESPRAAALAEGLCLLLGAGFTLALFLSVAHFTGGEAPEPEADFADLRAISVPLETPPPRPVETPPVPVAATPFAGLEVAAADSPVRIAVVPPDLAALMPESTAAPAARIDSAQLYAEFKPKTELGGDLTRIFQEHEVDQRPTVLSRPQPYIPPAVRNKADTLRISVIILIDTRGSVGSLRVLEGSGNKYFDEIILRDMRERWIFTPAIKNGRKVRCLVQQKVRVVWTGGTPFDSY